MKYGKSPQSRKSDSASRLTSSCELKPYEAGAKATEIGGLEKDRTVLPNGYATDHLEKWNTVRYSARKPTDLSQIRGDSQFTPRVKTVLLVDDEDGTRITIKWFLSNFGYTIYAVRSAEEALVLFDSKVHDLVITDNRMPGMSGTEMAYLIKLRSPSTPVLMYTGTPPYDHSCVNVVVVKPSHMLVLKQIVEDLLSASEASQSMGQPG